MCAARTVKGATRGTEELRCVPRSPLVHAHTGARPSSPRNQGFCVSPARQEAWPETRVERATEECSATDTRATEATRPASVVHVPRQPFFFSTDATSTAENVEKKRLGVNCFLFPRGFPPPRKGRRPRSMRRTFERESEPKGSNGDKGRRQMTAWARTQRPAVMIRWNHVRPSHGSTHGRRQVRAMICGCTPCGTRTFLFFFSFSGRHGSARVLTLRNPAVWCGIPFVCMYVCVCVCMCVYLSCPAAPSHPGRFGNGRGRGRGMPYLSLDGGREGFEVSPRHDHRRRRRGSQPGVGGVAGRQPHLGAADRGIMSGWRR